MTAAEAGALSPSDATDELYETGVHHLFESPILCFLKNVYGGLLFGFAGLFSLIIATGSHGLEDSNPVPFGTDLARVALTQRDRYTGYPMWLAMTALQRQGEPIYYIRCLLISWVGNLLGALSSSFFFSYLTNALAEEPYKSGVVMQVNSDIVESPWHVIFLKSIGCGYLVTLAMFFGTQNHDGISKALGLHIPFFMSITARLPHTVEYMYLSTIGMMLGAPLSVVGFLWKCMLPISLGNALGGAVFVGAFNWYVFMYAENKDKAKDQWANGVDDRELTA
ncbi:MAG: hypothetical protein Q9195_005261 [Heterodermia aff. obscurata]